MTNGEPSDPDVGGATTPDQPGLEAGGGGAQPRSGWSIDEGWGGGVQIAGAVEQTKKVWRVIQGDILNLLLVLVAAGFLVRVFGVSMSIVSEVTGLSFLGKLTEPVALVGSLVVTAFVTALLAPVRAAVVDGWRPADVDGVVQRTTSRWVRALTGVVVLGVPVFLGSLCCLIPGMVAAFFFSGVPYLAVTTSRQITGLFERSFELAKRHWQAILYAIAASIASGLASVAVWAVLWGAARAVGDSALLNGAVQISTALFSALVTIFMVVVGAGAWTAIDEREPDLGDVEAARGDGAADQLETEPGLGEPGGSGAEFDSDGAEW